ncbi:hypothetical protein VW29_11940 [Devosia limi DSM 17137]|uniref:Uncharacterized protein n=1 Tax=Devosia limi DSM 17137 TaxID=1121477 RepID=A0A0F5LR00_9HYPH|nr:hypothetical protein VW29_11940 [Devosia limi DSM 17137]
MLRRHRQPQHRPRSLRPLPLEGRGAIPRSSPLRFPPPTHGDDKAQNNRAPIPADPARHPGPAAPASWRAPSAWTP